MRSIALGAVSLVCLLFWGNYLLFYVDAIPVVIAAVTCAAWGIYLANRSAAQNEQGVSRWPARIGLVACWTGLIANIGLFAVSMIDL